jgi:hypothetical protein
MISKIPNKTPTDKVPIKGILHISLNIMCPALILARRRKHRVIGRTIILIISTNDKKGIRYQGVLAGKREETEEGLTIKIMTLANHKDKAEAKLKDKVVVTGKL